jgi:thioesterase domain-containing protein
VEYQNVQSNNKMDCSSIVAICSGNKGVIPIFCVPGAAASTSMFLELANAIDSKISLYGLEPRGLEDLAEPHKSIEAAASDFLPSILEIQPFGPYRFLGHSFGGWLALEIALQLVARKSLVEQLWLIDSDPPTDKVKRPVTVIDTVVKFVESFELRFKKRLFLSADIFTGCTECEAAKILRERLVASGMLHRRVTVEMLSARLRVFRTNLATGYGPRGVFNRAAYLLNAEDTVDDLVERERCWMQFVPNITAATVPGNHITMLLEPYVGSIGALLALDCIGDSIDVGNRPLD